MPQSSFIENIVDKLKDIQGLKAIVLGGSWASGTQHPDSDIDLGLYYSQDAPLDIPSIRKIAAQLNDFPNPVVTDLGEWGRWVKGINSISTKRRKCVCQIQNRNNKP